MNFLKKYWLTAGVFIAMIVLYHYMSTGETAHNYLFPPAKNIWEAFVENKESFGVNLLSSFSLLLPSLAIAIVLSLAIGIPIGLNKWLREALYPVLYIVSVVPAILLSPFALMLASNFRMASLFLIVYGCMFPTVFATITGIQTIDKRYLDRAKTLELSGIEKVVKVILPAASPSIFCRACNPTMRGSFLYVGIRRDVWCQIRNGILCKKILRIWYVSECMVWIYFHGISIGICNADF